MDLREEYIGSDIRVVVSDEHGFGTDAVLLADFASPKKNEFACDFGTGCGIIPMIWCRNNNAEHITAVEIQKNAYKQAVRSVNISGCENKVTILNEDLKDIKSFLSHSSMDLVTMNPPYKAAESGALNKSESEIIARHEVKCTLEDIAKAAAYILKFNGRLCMCNRPERLSDTIFAMKNAKIEPKRLRFVVKSPDKKPWLFLIEGRKGGRPFLNVEPLLIMYDDNGKVSAEVNEIYGEYKEI